MTTKEALKAVGKFKSLIIDLMNGNGNRSEIYQNIAQTKQITYIVGTHKSMTIAPPPIVGGPVMNNVDPLDMLFSAPYGLDDKIWSAVVDIMDETIGVLKANPHCVEEYNTEKAKETRDDAHAESNCSMKEQTPKIFISHNTKDTDYASAIISMLIALGVKHTDIFCSSVKGYGIPFGKKIIDTLHSQFDDYKLFVIFIHSPRYYESVVSLNEMGAAWILRSDYRSFLTKDCDFFMLTGVINSDEIAFKAGLENTEHLLHDFRRDIKDFFSLDDIPDAVWETTKNDFVEKVKSLQYEAKDEEPVKASMQKCVPDDADENEAIIMAYMKNAGKEVRMNEISADTGLSMNQTHRIVCKLMQEGKIRRIGHTKYGRFWLP